MTARRRMMGPEIGLDETYSDPFPRSSLRHWTRGRSRQIVFRTSALAALALARAALLRARAHSGFRRRAVLWTPPARQSPLENTSGQGFIVGDVVEQPQSGA